MKVFFLTLVLSIATFSAFAQNAEPKAAPKASPKTAANPATAAAGTVDKDVNVPIDEEFWKAVDTMVKAKNFQDAFTKIDVYFDKQCKQKLIDGYDLAAKRYLGYALYDGVPTDLIEKALTNVNKCLIANPDTRLLDTEIEFMTKAAAKRKASVLDVGTENLLLVKPTAKGQIIAVQTSVVHFRALAGALEMNGPEFQPLVDSLSKQKALTPLDQEKTLIRFQATLPPPKTNKNAAAYKAWLIAFTKKLSLQNDFLTAQDALIIDEATKKNFELVLKYAEILTGAQELFIKGDAKLWHFYTHAVTWNLRREAFQVLGMLKRGVDVTQAQIQALEAVDKDAYRLLGDLHADAHEYLRAVGKYTEAKKEIDQSLKDTISCGEPDQNLWRKNEVATMIGLLGDPTTAIKELEKIVPPADWKGKPEVYNIFRRASMALVYAANGNYEAAEKLVTISLSAHEKLLPDAKVQRAQIRLMKAAIMRRRGNINGAQSEMKLTLQENGQLAGTAIEFPMAMEQMITCILKKDKVCAEKNASTMEKDIAKTEIKSEFGNLLKAWRDYEKFLHSKSDADKAEARKSFVAAKDSLGARFPEVEDLEKLLK